MTDSKTAAVTPPSMPAVYVSGETEAHFQRGNVIMNERTAHDARNRITVISPAQIFFNDANILLMIALPAEN